VRLSQLLNANYAVCVVGNLGRVCSSLVISDVFTDEQISTSVQWCYMRGT